MVNDIQITVIGNLVADPEVRYTRDGQAVANFTIAHTPRTFDRGSNEWKAGDTIFLRSSAWRETTENLAGSLTKGMRVIASGRLKQSSWQTKEGEHRTGIELEVDEIGASLRYATAKITRVAKATGDDPADAQADAQAWPGEPSF